MSSDRRASMTSSPAEEDALFLDILHEAPLFGHRKPTSIIGSIFYCLLLASYAILAAGAPWIFHPLRALILPLLCSCDVILLIVTGIFHQYFVYQVQKIRLQGYYVFSQKLKHIARLPFATIAYGTAAILLAMVWKPYISILSITLLLRIIMLVEVVCAGFFMSIYIGYVHRYNSLDTQPDVLKSLYSPLQPSSSLEGLRYHDGGRLADQQMALLQYQRENLHFLSEEILRLQECLSKYEGTNNAITPQVDLAHLLAARDQELRTLSAEMNQLQDELRLARSLIAEKDTEIQHVRSTNNQYVDENERLRAILGEWSTRAAKLERALETERMSNLELQRKVLVVRNQPTHESTETT
ncbi:protein FIP1 [Diospyros lotus]|uniref:protein FIP1 n=1 Tax=Diospyros lotus TaxID=55363 RepID=UPI002250FF31|nr:protein FIP1 [Diospyros lotus]